MSSVTLFRDKFQLRVLNSYLHVGCRQVGSYECSTSNALHVRAHGRLRVIELKQVFEWQCSFLDIPNHNSTVIFTSDHFKRDIKELPERIDIKVKLGMPITKDLIRILPSQNKYVSPREERDIERFLGPVPYTSDDFRWYSHMMQRAISNQLMQCATSVLLSARYPP